MVEEKDEGRNWKEREQIQGMLSRHVNAEENKKAGSPAEDRPEQGLLREQGETTQGSPEGKEPTLKVIGPQDPQRWSGREGRAATHVDRLVFVLQRRERRAVTHRLEEAFALEAVRT